MLNVVFVHLGKASVEHLWLNLQRHRDLFPEQKVHVILSDLAHSQRAQALGIPVTYYQPTEFQNELLESLTHGSEFRQGFWRFTLERIFALETFHNQNPNASILHVESDVLLMPNFPFSELESFNLMAWTNYNSERDVSAILFSPSREQTSWLIREIEKILTINKSMTDMTALAQIRRSNLDRVVQLPGVNESLENQLTHCYDSAVIGMWLCGEDPRNHYGSLKLHNNSEFLRGATNFDPSKLIYSYSPKLGLQVEVGSQKILINCLHIHSKELGLFDQNWEERLIDFVKLSEDSKPKKVFLMPVLVQLLRDNFSQDTLLSFILGVPAIYRLRMWARQKLGM